MWTSGSERTHTGSPWKRFGAGREAGRREPSFVYRPRRERDQRLPAIWARRRYCYIETEIAEPDRDGGALRYRGVDIEELVGKVPFENVWGLLVDENIESPLPPAEKQIWSCRIRAVRFSADLQAGLRDALGLERGLQQLAARHLRRRPGALTDLARLSAATPLDRRLLRPRRGKRAPVADAEIDKGENAAAQFS